MPAAKRWRNVETQLFMCVTHVVASLVPLAASLVLGQRLCRLLVPLAASCGRLATVSDLIVEHETPSTTRKEFNKRAAHYARRGKSAPNDEGRTAPERSVKRDSTEMGEDGP